MSEHEFNPLFERQVVGRCMTDKKYMAAAAQFVGQHNFSDPSCAWIFDRLLTLWKKHRELASAELVLTAVRRTVKGERRVTLSKALADIVDVEADGSPNSALDELREFVRFQELRTATVDAAEKLASGEVGEAENVLSSALKSRAGEVRFEVGDWQSEYDERQRERRRRVRDGFKGWKTGVRLIDETTGGGARPSWLAVLQANTGVGKSMFFVNFALAAALQGASVAVFCLEMARREFEERVDARVVGLPSIRLRNYDLTKQERFEGKKIIESLDGLRGMINTVEVLLTDCTIELIEAAIEEIENKNGAPVNVVFFDSLDHVRYHDSRMNTTERVTAIYNWAKRYAVAKKKLVWSTTQQKREYAGRAGGPEAGSNSYAKAQNADLVFGIWQTREEMRRKLLHGELAKGRHFESGGGRALFQLDFSRSKFVELENEELDYDEDDGEDAED